MIIITLLTLLGSVTALTIHAPLYVSCLIPGEQELADGAVYLDRPLRLMRSRLLPRTVGGTESTRVYSPYHPISRLLMFPYVALPDIAS